MRKMNCTGRCHVRTPENLSIFFYPFDVHVSGLCHKILKCVQISNHNKIMFECFSGFFSDCFFFVCGMLKKNKKWNQNKLNIPCAVGCCNWRMFVLMSSFFYLYTKMIIKMTGNTCFTQLTMQLYSIDIQFNW